MKAFEITVGSACSYAAVIVVAESAAAAIPMLEGFCADCTKAETEACATDEYPDHTIFVYGFDAARLAEIDADDTPADLDMTRAHVEMQESGLNG